MERRGGDFLLEKEGNEGEDEMLISYIKSKLASTFLIITSIGVGSIVTLIV